jgi:hypothetical protein
MRYGFEAAIAAITLCAGEIPYDGKMQFGVLVSPSSIRWTLSIATLMAASSSFPYPLGDGVSPIEHSE